MSDSTELAILPAALSPAVVFAPGGVDDILAQVRAKVAEVPKDISTPENRARIKSAAYAVARSKTGAIDAERKKIRDEMDALKDEVRRPLTEWEEAERKRVADELAREKAEAEKREKDKKHKASVNNAAVTALSKEAAISEDTAKAVITAIAKGLIPNVKISY